MKKTEFAVGETFQFGLKKLKVVEQPPSPRCTKCLFYGFCEPDYFQDYILPLVGECVSYERSDKKNVMFVEVEDEK